MSSPEAGNVEPATNVAALAALKAFTAVANGRLVEAALVWTSGASALHGDRPLWTAAALHNAAVGNILLQEMEAACLLLERAHSCCEETGAPEGLRSTSSGFHVRLASRHPASFAAASGRRVHQLQRLLRAHIRYHHRIATHGSADSSALADVTASLSAAPAAGSLAILSAASLDDVRRGYGSRAVQLQRALHLAQHHHSRECIPFIVGLLTPVMLGGMTDAPIAGHI